MTAHLRPELAQIPAYTPGKTVPGAIKLASNETVYGPLPSVRAAIENATDNVNRYPDNGNVELRDHLAKHLDFAPEQIDFVSCLNEVFEQPDRLRRTAGQLEDLIRRGITPRQGVSPRPDRRSS